MTFRILHCTLVVLLTIAVSLTSGYPEGAPDSACDSMMPGHDVDSQNSEPPFTISLSGTTVQAGETIEVTLTSDTGTVYEGLLLKVLAEDENTGAAGSFIIHDNDVASYHTLNCSGILKSAITHSNSNYKTNITATWIAPSYNGKFVFAATVLKDYETFWAKYISDDTVEVIGGTTKPVPPPTTPASNIDFDYSQCGKNISCMGEPSQCIVNEDCSVLLTFCPTPDEYDSVSFELISNSGGYVAMGLSEDQFMGGDSVVECMTTSPDVQIRASTNDGHNNEMAAGDNTQYFTPLSGSFNGGILKCEFKRSLITTVDGITTDLTNDYFILLAFGQLSEGTDISYHTNKWASSIAVNLSSPEFIIVDPGESSLPVQIILHGSFMVFSWVILAGVAVFLARFYKDMWPEKTHCGVKIWFAWHRGLNVINVIITLSALIIIFIYTGTDTSFSTNAHPSMGIITIILMLMQPIGAIFRPHPDAPNRKIFNWLHFTGGMLACCCGVITINLSVTLKSSHLKTYFVYIVCGFVLFYILMFGCMEFLIRIHLPKEKDLLVQCSEAVVKTKRKIHYKEVVLGIYCCGVVSFATAMIAIIATS